VFYFITVFVITDDPATYRFEIRGFDSSGKPVRNGKTKLKRSTYIRAFQESDKTFVKGFLEIQNWVEKNW
jgi:hypothetical protein